MKLKIEKVLGSPMVRDIPKDDGSKLKLTTVKVRGTVDGDIHAEMLAKAWNGDAALIVAGAELWAKVDEKRRDGDPPSFVIGPLKPSGGRSEARGGGFRGMDKMQFLLDQRAKMAIAALNGAVEMTKGSKDNEKVVPLAEKMFGWLTAKSMIELGEKNAKED